MAHAEVSEKVGISKIKDGWLSQDLGGKMLTIETGIGNWLADVVDGYHPAHILEFNEKKQKVKSYEQLCELEESVAKKIKTKFLQKICLLCMRSLGEQDSISSGEIISIENMCKIWNIQHSEVIEWYQSMYEIIKIGFGGLVPLKYLYLAITISFKNQWNYPFLIPLKRRG